MVALKKMLTMLKKISKTFAICLITFSANAEGLKVSGSFDIYSTIETNKRSDGLSHGLTAFTNAPTEKLDLGMASIKFDYTYKKINTFIDLGWGMRATQFAYQEPTSSLLSATKQAYISYAFNDRLKFTAGTWATHIGYEVYIDPLANKNYTVSHLFTYGPYTHSGVMADYIVDEHNFMFGLSTPSDRRRAKSGDNVMFLAKYGYVEKNWSIYFNYYGSPFTYNTDGLGTKGKSNQIDVVLNSNLTDKFHLGYNVSYRHNEYETLNASSFIGNALYLNHQTLSWLSLNWRGEYFTQSAGNTFVVNQTSLANGSPVYADAKNFIETTFSLNIAYDKFVLIPEVRYDWAEKNIFGTSKENLKNNFTTFLLAWVYKF